MKTTSSTMNTMNTVPMPIARPKRDLKPKHKLPVKHKPGAKGKDKPKAKLTTKATHMPVAPAGMGKGHPSAFDKRDKLRKGRSPAQRRAQGRQAAQKKRKTSCMKRLK